MKTLTRRAAVLVMTLLIAACANGFSQFPVEPEDQAALEENLRIVRLDPQNIASFNPPARMAQSADTFAGPAAWRYRVGAGDILSVLVFNHPELTMPAGPTRSAAETGFRVQSDGTFFYPFVGQVQAAGLAPEEIRADLMVRLAEFIADPQIEVRVASFNSQAINVTGAVGTPSRLPLTTVPTTLVDAINAAGGLMPNADPSGVTIQRNRRTYRIDFESFLERGNIASNPMLGSGDVVFVPAREVEEVFLLGEVGRPASIDLAGEVLSLTQALARQGGLDELRADARGIFVFRGHHGNMTVFQLSVESPTGYLLGTQFELKAGDVIYVTRSPRQRWNDAIFGLLPTVTAVDSASATIDGL